MAVATTSVLGAGAQQDMFMNLLIAQLQNQNPMDPMSNSEMVSQMAQLASVDSLNRLNLAFRDVLKLQALMSGTELVGRQVEYTYGDSVRSGTVQSVTAGSAGVTMCIGGVDVPLDNVLTVL
jgi:flagellar basal-body rod modification protein FlgD